ncbi:MAG TPA: UDP-N-acetylglucosamine 2-epimerase (non-hydrolyzing) [Bacillota bacterium]|nr:UDP-N-acetylglucosamine 2-epimerase (non-hydrolyzing) [Bacillota bacterium]
MRHIKVLSVFGTRPDTIKLAPVVNELSKYPELIDSVTCGTAQHREMMDQVLGVFGITPDYDLGVMRDDQTLFDIAERGLRGLQEVLERERPDITLVHGDTSTAFVGALASFYCKVKVGHVEAGLRTNQKYDPFPEEMNRRLVGCLSDLHFAPTGEHLGNLLRENFPRSNIYVTGNTVVDAVLAVSAARKGFADARLASIDFTGRRLVLVTAHRRENIGEPLEAICGAVRDVLGEFPDTLVVMPVHPNPRVRSTVVRELSGVDRCYLIDPVSYPDMVGLMQRCFMVMTDSGGLQEEAPALGKPVLVLRRTTERPEGLRAGTLRLVGVSREGIRTEAGILLSNTEKYRQMAESPNPYGDGKASKRIVSGILHHFGMVDERPADFA